MMRVYTAAVNDSKVPISCEELRKILDISETISRSYKNAPAAVQSEGASWYTGKAAAFAEHVAEECDLDFDTAAAIVAVCSPRTRWSTQVKNTIAMVRHLQNGGTPDTAPLGALFVRERAKAAAILQGDRSALCGPKVETFYRNICGDETVVTIDVWAVRVALDDPDADEATINLWIRGRRRIILEAAYHFAAQRLGVSVAAVQAVTWVAIRCSAD